MTKPNGILTKKVCDCGTTMLIGYDKPQEFKSTRPNKDVFSAYHVDFVLDNVGAELAQCTECGVCHWPGSFQLFVENKEQSLPGKPQKFSVLVLLGLVLLPLLGACQHKGNKLAPAVDEKAYCAEHPTECVLTAQEGK